jgi:putative PIN family toxin of toxin-antitoxin system
MGKKEKEVRRVVLDTNVMVSALLFKGSLSKIVDHWKEGKFIPLLSKETFNEFKAVLEYPKFSLTRQEIKAIIEEEVLPFFEIVDAPGKIGKICRDSDDDKFIACAASGAADFIVSGDRDLLDMVKCKSVKIISASEFLKMF